MEDWRLTNQMKYLYKKTLMRVSFLEYPEKDHEHCSFCWEKFSRLNETLKEGYGVGVDIHGTISQTHTWAQTSWNEIGGWFKDKWEWVSGLFN